MTATDLALHVTQMLRKAKVVGKFVEFFGPGAASLPVADRATIANMAPEYGATMGFFPVDDESAQLLAGDGTHQRAGRGFRQLFQGAGDVRIPAKGDIDYSVELELDLADVKPSVAGPKRPQDRIDLPSLKSKFDELFSKPLTENGYNKPAAELGKRFPRPSRVEHTGRATAPSVCWQRSCFRQ